MKAGVGGVGTASEEDLPQTWSHLKSFTIMAVRTQEHTTHVLQSLFACGL